MKRSLALSVLVIMLEACEREPSKTPRPVPAPVVSAMPVSVASLDAAPPSLSSPAAPDASSTPAPIKVERTGKTWPFHAWNRAEAVTFNQFPMRPGAPLVVYNDKAGWSPHLVDRKALDLAQGKKAADFVMQTNGDVEVSKCPFPRHAVVLYEDTVPVASINVCFSCGDIVLWPGWEAEPDWSKMSEKQIKERELRHEKQTKLYDEVFPKWQAFFRDEVGFPIDQGFH